MSGRLPEWPVVRAHCEKHIEASRRNLEQRGLDAQTTEFERGQISAMRAILRLSDPAPETPSTEPFIHY
jgi:hypothetical protein